MMIRDQQAHANTQPPFPAFSSQMSRHILPKKSDVRKHVPDWFFRYLRYLIYGLFYPLRQLPGMPLLRGKMPLSQNDMLSQGVNVVWTFETEKPLEPKAISPEYAILVHSQIATDVVTLDIQTPGYRFANNQLITPRREVIYNDIVSFFNLPTGLERLETPQQVSGTVAYLSETWVQNYYHWMCYTLPLVERYRAYLGRDADYYYLGKQIRSWHYDSLAKLGISRERVLTKAVTADRLVTIVVKRQGAVNTSFLDFARRSMLEGLPQKKAHKRLFIGRGITTTRRLLNERECAALLAEFGFEYLTMDGLTLQDEIDLFSEASVIIMPHGAALTNLLYAPKCVKVLELSPYNNHAPNFAIGYEIGAFLGCTYGALRGEYLASNRTRRTLDEDIYIDPAKLKVVVNRLLTL
jgi:hypothetical protein